MTAEKTAAALKLSLSFNQRSWRVAAAAVSWWLAFRVIDPGSADFRQYSQTLQIGLWVAFVVCILFAFGCFVQAIQAPGQNPVRWFPPREDRGRLFTVIALEVLLILSVAGISLAWPRLWPRPAIAGLGVWLIYLTLSRNPALFRLAALRSSIGERPAQLVYVCFGVGLIAIAIFASM